MVMVATMVRHVEYCDKYVCCTWSQSQEASRLQGILICIRIILFSENYMERPGLEYYKAKKTNLLDAYLS